MQVQCRLKRAEQQAEEPPLLRKIKGQMEEIHTQFISHVMFIGVSSLLVLLLWLFPESTNPNCCLCSVSTPPLLASVVLLVALLFINTYHIFMFYVYVYVLSSYSLVLVISLFIIFLFRVLMLRALKWSVLFYFSVFSFSSLLCVCSVSSVVRYSILFLLIF